MSNYISGAIIGILATIILLCVFALGVQTGKDKVVADCAYYQKSAIDGTQYLLCSAIIKPSDLEPTIAETNAKFYSKENKDLHKKDRK